MTKFNGTSRPSLRAALLAFGWCNLVLGMIGAMVPVMPSMVFLLISLWCFSKGSERFHTWLYEHRVFGRQRRRGAVYSEPPQQRTRKCAGPRARERAGRL